MKYSDIILSQVIMGDHIVIRIENEDYEGQLVALEQESLTLSDRNGDNYFFDLASIDSLRNVEQEYTGEMSELSAALDALFAGFKMLSEEDMKTWDRIRSDIANGTHALLQVNAKSRDYSHGDHLTDINTGAAIYVPIYSMASMPHGKGIGYWYQKSNTFGNTCYQAVEVADLDTMIQAFYYYRNRFAVEKCLAILNYFWEAGFDVDYLWWRTKGESANLRSLKRTYIYQLGYRKNSMPELSSLPRRVKIAVQVFVNALFRNAPQDTPLNKREIRTLVHDAFALHINVGDVKPSMPLLPCAA